MGYQPLKSLVTIQENQYTVLQSYHSPLRAFCVRPKEKYEDRIEYGATHSYLVNRFSYVVGKICGTMWLAALPVYYFLTLILRVPTPSGWYAIPIGMGCLAFISTMAWGISNEHNDVHGSGTNCWTVEQALEKAIAYQEKLTSKVATNVEYDEYVKNLAETLNPPLIGNK